MDPFPPVAEMAAAVRNGSVAHEHWVSLTLQRIAATEQSLRAFLHVDEKGSQDQLELLRTKLSSGARLPLAGVPVAVKDNICTLGTPTTCASRILENFTSPYDATAVARLREAGAIIVGKTNLDEFGMGSSTENSAFQVTRNPWDLGRVPGGSSGGSAAAVAAGVVPVALGSDTGGSIRQPASFTGIVGLKPTYGRVSRYGLVAYGSSLDQIGPLARSVDDALLVLSVIAGLDRRDATCSDAPTDDLLTDDPRPLSELTIGLPKEYLGNGIDTDVLELVRRAAHHLEEAGARVVEVSLPHTEYAIPAYYLVATSEASSNLARYDGIHYGRRAAARDVDATYLRSRAEGFGREVKRRILLGTFSLSAGYRDAYYDRAMRVRTLIRQDFDTVLSHVDVLLAPTTPTPAFRLGEKLEDPLQMYLADVLTVAANLARIPGLTVPAGWVTREGKRLPVGVQLLGKPFAESLLGHVGGVLASVPGTSSPLPVIENAP